MKGVFNRNQGYLYFYFTLFTKQFDKSFKIYVGIKEVHSQREKATYLGCILLNSIPELQK